MSKLKADADNAISAWLREEFPEETERLILTSWAVVGYFEHMDPDDEDEEGAFSAVTGSGSAVTTIGLLRMGERFMLSD